jgi:hypothetical protein
VPPWFRRDHDRTRIYLHDHLAGATAGSDLDPSVIRKTLPEHLGALDVVYAGIIEAHRRAIGATEELDQVTQDMLIGQCGQLEQFHWFGPAPGSTPGRRGRRCGTCPRLTLPPGRLPSWWRLIPTTRSSGPGGP